MSETQPPAVPPAVSVVEGGPPPQAAQPAAPEPMLHAVICPDTSNADAKPVYIAGCDESTFLAAVHDRIRRIKKGWAYVFMHGRHYTLSDPITVFQIRGAGRTIAMGEKTPPVWSQGGRFDYVPMRRNDDDLPDPI